MFIVGFERKYQFKLKKMCVCVCVCAYISTKLFITGYSTCPPLQSRQYNMYIILVAFLLSSQNIYVLLVQNDTSFCFFRYIRENVYSRNGATSFF